MDAVRALRHGQCWTMLLLSIVSGILGGVFAVYPIVLLVACDGNLDSDDCDVPGGLHSLFLLLAILTAFFVSLCVYFAVMTCCCGGAAGAAAAESDEETLRSQPHRQSGRTPATADTTRSRGDRSSSSSKQPPAQPSAPSTLPTFNLRSGSPTSAASATVHESERLRQNPFSVRRIPEDC